LQWVLEPGHLEFWKSVISVSASELSICKWSIACMMFHQDHEDRTKVLLSYRLNCFIVGGCVGVTSISKVFTSFPFHSIYQYLAASLDLFMQWGIVLHCLCEVSSRSDLRIMSYEQNNSSASSTLSFLHFLSPLPWQRSLWSFIEGANTAITTSSAWA